MLDKTFNQILKSEIDYIVNTFIRATPYKATSWRFIHRLLVTAILNLIEIIIILLLWYIWTSFNLVGCLWFLLSWHYTFAFTDKLLVCFHALSLGVILR